MAAPHIAVKGFSEFWDTGEPDRYQERRADIIAKYEAAGWPVPFIHNELELRYAICDFDWLTEQISQAQATG